MRVSTLALLWMKLVVSLLCTTGIDFVLLQLSLARMIITILSARAKVEDFEDDFFMGFLGLED
jgi:hypothetical protein